MGRIAELESLRGLMAIWVVIVHIVSAAGLHAEKWVKPFSLLGQGGYAVEVFIILSGFVIFFLLDKNKENPSTFLIRRFFRLFPAYFACLIVSIFLVEISLEVLRWLPWEHSHNQNRIKIFEDSLQYFVPHIIAHLTMLHGAISDAYLPSSSYAFIGQAWSISTEWQFYLVAPLLYFLIAKKHIYYLLLMLIMVSFIFFAMRGPPAFLPTQIPNFLIGIASYYVWKYREQMLNLSHEQWPFMMPIAAVSVSLLTESIPLIIWTIVFFSILGKNSSVNCTIEAGICRVLNTRGMLYLGKISYSVYLSHMIVLYGVSYILKSTGIDFSQVSYAALLLVLVPVLTILISQMLYKIVEKPCIQIGKQITAPLMLTDVRR